MSGQLSLFEEEITVPVPTLSLSRHALDFYETPDWMPRTMFEYIDDIRGTVLECCVGDWAIASVIKQRFSNIELFTNDIDPNRKADFHLDATQPKSWKKFPEVDWIVTNPPYGEHCAPIIKNALAYAQVGIVMFSRMTFLEPWDDRADWLDQNPPTFTLALPRYAFRKNKHDKWAYDSAAVWGICWRKDDKSYRRSFVVRSAKSINGFYRNPSEAKVK